MKAREYLVSMNLAKAGRGKFSHAAKEYLATAIAGGMEFSDYGDKVEREEVGYETPAMTWPEGRAFFLDTGKETSMKNACNTCGYSLYWCECAHPSVLTRGVKISTRKT